MQEAGLPTNSNALAYCRLRAALSKSGKREREVKLLDLRSNAWLDRVIETVRDRGVISSTSVSCTIIYLLLPLLLAALVQECPHRSVPLSQLGQLGADRSRAAGGRSRRWTPTALEPGCKSRTHARTRRRSTSSGSSVSDGMASMSMLFLRPAGHKGRFHPHPTLILGSAPGGSRFAVPLGPAFARDS